MKNITEEPRDAQVENLLQSLQPVPERDPQAAADGRARFLNQAAVQSARKLAVLPVSAGQERRHNGWFEKIFRKELPKMSVLTTLLLIVALAFGGGGAAYAAAQPSLPDQPLYGLKIAGEDMQIQLTANEQNRMELTLKFSQRRVDEMEQMAGAGQEIPTSVQTRWQEQVQQALQLAANMPEEGTRTRALVRVYEQLQNQAQLMEQATDVPLMQQTRQMVQQQLRQVEQIMAGEPGANNGQGGASPAGGNNNPWTTGTPTPGSSYGPGPGTCDDCTPQGAANTPQGGNNPYTTGTPTPGSSYGPGPGTCDSCTPQGAANTPQGGNNPYTTGTPTPGSSYGPGPGTCDSCTPQGGSNTPQGTTNTPQGGNNPYTTGTPTPGSGYGPGAGNTTNTPSGPKGKS